jgi:hypothetical protein
VTTTPGESHDPGQLGRSRTGGAPRAIVFGLPFMVRVIVYAATGFVLAYLACVAWDFDRLYHGFSTARMGAWLAVAALIGVLVTAHLIGADGRVHREFGSTDRFVAYHQALRTGVLPARIDPEAWRRWLHVSRGANRTTQVVAWLLVAFVVVPDLIRAPRQHLLFAVLVGLLAFWRLLSARRTRAQIATMAADVERRAGLHLTPREAQMMVGFRQPRAVHTAAVTTTGFGCAVVVAELDRVYAGASGSWVRLLGWAAVVGFAAAIHLAGRWPAGMRGDASSADESFAYAQALRTRQLPAHLQPDAWRRWLRSSRRSNRQEPFWALVIVMLGVAPSLISDSAYWVTAAFFGLVATLTLRSWWSVRASITALKPDVDGHTR